MPCMLNQNHKLIDLPKSPQYPQYSVYSHCQSTPPPTLLWALIIEKLLISKYKYKICGVGQHKQSDVRRTTLS